MAFDYKKEYKEFYLPKNKPAIVTIPPMNYLAVRGKGDPNEKGGEYKAAVGVLYALAYTLKMSYKTGYAIDGFFEYVVPPLEGFWWSENGAVDFRDKSAPSVDFRHPPAGFCRREGFPLGGGGGLSEEKAGLLCRFFLHPGGRNLRSNAAPGFLRQRAGLPGGHRRAFARETGFVLDLSQTRRHHEIYL